MACPGKVGAGTLYLEPGSPWENGYLESFNGKLRDELLAREVFDTPLEAKVLVTRWRRQCNAVRPHSSLGYRPPAREAVQPWYQGWLRYGGRAAAGQAVGLTQQMVSLMGAGHSRSGRRQRRGERRAPGVVYHDRDTIT